MGLFRYLRRRREEKLEDTTIPKKPYWVWFHKLTSHAVKRMNERKITKGEVYTNLTTKPIHKSKIKWDNENRPSYQRISKNGINTAINPFNQKIVTVRREHAKKVDRYIRGNKRR